MTTVIGDYDDAAIRELLADASDEEAQIILDALAVDLHLRDPARWVRERLGEQLWSKQRDILESVSKHRRTAVHSSHAAGKSHLAARVACWWVDCHPPGTAFVVSTAPSWAQVRAILWRYIGQVHRKAKLIGRVNQTEWFLGDDLVGYGRKPPDNDEEGFQGIHATYVLVIVDEAAGIPSALWVAILALLTTKECRVLAIGNPDYEGSAFSRMCSPGSGWNVIHIDGLETPNFTDEPKPAGAPLLDQSWIDDLVADYGIESPQYMAKVRGLFPSDRTDGVVPWSWVHRCRDTETPPSTVTPVELGVDVGGGTDLTVIRERRGGAAGRRWTVNTEDSEVIVDETLAAIRVSKATTIKVDFGGIGFGVVGSLRRRVAAEIAWPVTIHAVEFGGSAKDPGKYLNVRAEMYWEARLRSKDRGWWLGAVDTERPGAVPLVDERTIADLTEARWFENKRGLIQIEAKDEIRKRLGRSPDDADALVLAFYDPPEDTGAQPMTSFDYRPRGRGRR